MEKFFEWFNERTQRERILLIIIPLVFAFVLWLNFIQPLLSEKRKLEEELENLRATQFLIAKKLALEKKIKELEAQIETKDLSLEELLNIANKYGIFITKFEEVSPRGISVQKRGKKVVFYKGRKKKNKRGINVEFTIYNLNILAPEEKVKSFIEHIYTNYPAVLTGFYKGCLGEKEALRRISVPLACNTGRDYENIICKDADLSGYVYLLNLVTINVEGKK